MSARDKFFVAVIAAGAFAAGTMLAFSAWFSVAFVSGWVGPCPAMPEWYWSLVPATPAFGAITGYLAARRFTTKLKARA